MHSGPSTNSELELRAFKVHAPAPQALRDVINVLQSREMDVFYAIRSRVKSVQNIIEKTLRKRTNGKVDYEPEDINRRSRTGKAAARII